MKEEAVLVTGGAGYIGSHMARQLVQDNETVIVFDNLSKGWKEPLEIIEKEGNLQFYRGDLRIKQNINRVFEEYSIKEVYHFAALCSVDESTKYPLLYFENNVTGTIHLLEAMRKTKPRLIFSSTCAVYANTNNLPIKETHPLMAMSPYGESKLITENFIDWYGETYGIKYAILRYFNVCGAAEDGKIGDSKNPSLLLVQNAVRGALGIEPFKLTYSPVNTKDGSPIRDYIDVLDLVDAHKKANDYIKNNPSCILNIGNGKGWSVLEIVKEVERHFNKKLERSKGKIRSGEIPAIYADNTKAKQILSLSPKRSIHDSIEELKLWYKNKPHGYDY
ncbi:MAG: UDP-glucose 4-epimerase GalE [Candidatus Microsyncoccus archaeolyticus]|nr:MAG: UDP-glucose 4-epimerase GalE [Candidatus Parcubacteria bacterium]